METANNNAICNSKKDASRANVVDSTKNGYCIYDIYCWLFQICLLKDNKNPNNLIFDTLTDHSYLNAIPLQYQIF